MLILEAGKIFGQIILDQQYQYDIFFMKKLNYAL